jgi:hypothetical protein
MRDRYLGTRFAALCDFQNEQGKCQKYIDKSYFHHPFGHIFQQQYLGSCSNAALVICEEGLWLFRGVCEGKKRFSKRLYIMYTQMYTETTVHMATILTLLISILWDSGEFCCIF